MGFVKTRDEDETANLIWSDSAVQQEKIAELRNYQVERQWGFLTCFCKLLHSEMFSNVSLLVSYICTEREKNPTKHHQPDCNKAIPLCILKSSSLFQSYLFIALGICCLNTWGCSLMLLSASWVLWMIRVLKKMQNIIYKLLISF